MKKWRRKPARNSLTNPVRKRNKMLTSPARPAASLHRPLDGLPYLRQWLAEVVQNSGSES